MSETTDLLAAEALEASDWCNRVIARLPDSLLPSPEDADPPVTSRRPGSDGATSAQDRARNFVSPVGQSLPPG